jgi:hypothetical protein
MEEKNHKIATTVHIFKLVADDVASIFPYFLAFYLISLLLSMFFTAWQSYFYWPAFHASVIVLALISLSSEKAKTFWNGVMDISRRGMGGSFEVVGRGATIIGRGGLLLRDFLAIIFYAVVVPVWKKILFWNRNLGKSGYLKLAITLLILIFSLFKGILVLDFFVLFIGLVSVLFGLDMRISAGFAFVLLMACPILLVFDGSVFAETTAIYAYYFLIIAVLTGVGGYLKGKTGFLRAG